MTRPRIRTAPDRTLWRAARLAALTDAPDAYKRGLADWYRGGEEEWMARLEMTGTFNVVAVGAQDERPVGLVRGVPQGAEVAQVRSLWVCSTVRGQGLGDRLLSLVTGWAQRSGVRALSLAVLPGNVHALALYERHGFVRAGRTGDPVPSGAREHLMAKPLR
ncbi:GNAT family N-acetyltransferase [Streptomyces tubbatahanensis]|uniref:GNAT family N-acetyltransferase n=1 Tax=Streptomyces tubbatahanensis TaxID=2923272 RepID=A0ABY3Y0R8_9ACTN|nr:GNAT family N-acetyltransferase [Streptomyces tubbatahanensis]UNT00195.1 GNAT family N-acetyltransferase [Streptomyces tubbatahanensis]